jgi:hypothetical protein
MFSIQLELFVTVRVMSENRLRLSAGEVRKTAKASAKNDFTFIVCEYRYAPPWFIAAFLSPKFGRLQSIDRTVQQLLIETKDRKTNSLNFFLLLQGLRVI